MEKVLKISRNILFYITLDKGGLELILKALRYLLTDNKYNKNDDNNIKNERKDIDFIIREIESELKKK